MSELREENDYQLKLKEMNYAERIRDLTDKFMQEMENLKTKLVVVTGEKDKEASKHGDTLHDLMEKQTKELQDLGTIQLLRESDARSVRLVIRVVLVSVSSKLQFLHRFFLTPHLN